MHASVCTCISATCLKSNSFSILHSSFSWSKRFFNPSSFFFVRVCGLCNSRLGVCPPFASAAEGPGGSSRRLLGKDRTLAGLWSFFPALSRREHGTNSQPCALLAHPLDPFPNAFHIFQSQRNTASFLTMCSPFITHTYYYYYTMPAISALCAARICCFHVNKGQPVILWRPRYYILLVINSQSTLFYP